MESHLWSDDLVSLFFALSTAVRWSTTSWIGSSNLGTFWKTPDFFIFVTLLYKIALFVIRKMWLVAVIKWHNTFSIKLLPLLEFAFSTSRNDSCSRETISRSSAKILPLTSDINFLITPKVLCKQISFAARMIDGRYWKKRKHLDFITIPLFWKYVVKLRSLICFYFCEDIVWKRTDAVLFLKENP